MELEHRSLNALQLRRHDFLCGPRSEFAGEFFVGGQLGFAGFQRGNLGDQRLDLLGGLRLAHVHLGDGHRCVGGEQFVGFFQRGCFRAGLLH